MKQRIKSLDKRTFIDTITGWGADIVKIADTALLEGIETEPADLLTPFPRAVSIAVRLSNHVMDGIDDRPTPLYASHYGRVNLLLDDLAVRTTNLLQAAGFLATPIPASMIIDRQRWTSFISHKAVAINAGVGWQGKSLLLITPAYGPRVRLVTVLTNAPLEPDPPVKNRCGTCTACRDHCPAGAIRGVRTAHHYASRNEAIDLAKCAKQVIDIFGELPHIVPGICGVCIKVCPWGTRRVKADNG